MRRSATYRNVERRLPGGISEIDLDAEAGSLPAFNIEFKFRKRLFNSTVPADLKTPIVFVRNVPDANLQA